MGIFIKLVWRQWVWVWVQICRPPPRVNQFKEFSMDDLVTVTILAGMAYGTYCIIVNVVPFFM